MMVAVFAAMSLALAVGRFGGRRLAMGAVVVCLALTVWLFLDEIHSPKDGYAMPWLKTMRAAPAGASA